MFLVAAGLACVTVVGLFAFTAAKARQIERMFPPQGRFVAFAGGRIHYTERRPDGVPRATVVLLHGASGNQADMMIALGDRLAARGYRVIAPDRPGHGWSDRIAGRAAASPAVQARLLRAAIDAIGVDGAIVVGHSFSGTLAIDFALDHRDFTQGLVLVAPVSHPWPGAIDWYYRVAATPVAGDLFTRLVTLPIGLHAMPAALAFVFAPQGVPADYAGKTGACSILRPAEFMANAQDIAGLKDFVTEQAPRERAISMPTAIVTGDEDAVVSPSIHSRASARAIPGATLAVLSGVGHSPHYADPERVVAAIEDVVTRSGR